MKMDFQPPDLLLLLLALSLALSLPLTFHSDNMAAHWGLGWRGASWDGLRAPAPAMASGMCGERQARRRLWNRLPGCHANPGPM